MWEKRAELCWGGGESNSNKHTYTDTCLVQCTHKYSMQRQTKPWPRISMDMNCVPSWMRLCIDQYLCMENHMCTDRFSKLLFSFRLTSTDTPTLVIDNHNGQHVVFAQHHSELVASNTAKCSAVTTEHPRHGVKEKERGKRREGGELQKRGEEKRGEWVRDPFRQRGREKTRLNKGGKGRGMS